MFDWFTFKNHFFQLPISPHPMHVLHIPCMCQWFLVFKEYGWGCWFGWVAHCLFWMRFWAAEYIHDWKWHSKPVGLKHSGNESRSLGQTENFVFCFRRALYSVQRIFCQLSESLAAEPSWYSSIVNYFWFACNPEWLVSLFLVCHWWMTRKSGSILYHCFWHYE